MKTFTKYTLFQVPGWVMAAIILYGLGYWGLLPAWVAAGLFVIWVGKDFALYPFLRVAYQSDAKTGAEQLVGLRGVARDRLDPRGYVQVHGEMWRAEATAGPIEAGSRIRVTAANDFTLIVEPLTWKRPDGPAPVETAGK